MTYARPIFAVSSAFLLTACSSVNRSDGTGIGPNTPTSNLVTLEANGDLPDQGFATTGTNGSGSFLRINNGTVSGYRFAYGRIEGTDEFRAVAGFAPNSDPGDAITTGTVTYDGTYKMAYISNTEQTLSGDITLMANLAGGTVTGAADGLVVDGVFTGTDLDGVVRYGGVNAGLAGVVGQDRVVGAFAGNTSEAVLVGGIFANAP